MSTKPEQLRTSSEKRLSNKVALIVESKKSGGRNLAQTLARNGADIAIVLRQADADDARKTKKLVEREGRRCLIVHLPKANAIYSREAIRQIVEELGRLDIFVDNSELALVATE